MPFSACKLRLGGKMQVRALPMRPILGINMLNTKLPESMRRPMKDPGDGMWHFWICGAAVGCSRTEKEAQDWLERNEHLIAQELYNVISEGRMKGKWE